MMMMMSYIMKADADDESMTPKRNDRITHFGAYNRPQDGHFLFRQSMGGPLAISVLAIFTL